MKIIPLCAALGAALLLIACSAAVTPIESATAEPTIAPTQTAAAASESQVIPSSLTWNPSGRCLAYTSADGRAWLLQRGQPQAVAIEGIQVGYPAELHAVWSPDGSNLLIYGVWGEPASTGMWLAPMSADGSAQAQVLVTPAALSSPVEQNSGAINAAAWSPDSALIAYILHAEVWIYELASAQTRQVSNISQQPLARTYSSTPYDGISSLAWSPDGLRLALAFTCNCPSPWSGVGILDLATMDIKLLVDGGQDISWSPDGRWISFQNTSGDWTASATFDYYGVEPVNGAITNLTRSNPDWDPLRPAEGAYADAPYQTSGLRWSPDGSYLYSILDYTLGQAPAWGMMVQSAPQTVVAQRPASAHTWYIFPAWLADGRYAWLEADPVASDDYTFALTRAAVGVQAAPLEMPSVSGAAWTSDGSALALCTTDEANAASAQVVVVELASEGEK